MRNLTALLGTPFALAVAVMAGAQTGLPVTPEQAQAPHWVRGAEIELMVVREVNSRTSKSGDHVDLRVNSPVFLDGKIAIPVGAAATGEVTSVNGTSAVGGKGRISLRLLSVDTRWGPVKLSGGKGEAGSSNTGGVVSAVLGFGLLGLLTKGGNAVFKGGDIITGYIDQGGNQNVTPLIVGP